MAEKVEISYYENKDILYIHILPKKPSKVVGNEYDFLIHYDWDNPNKIVGFEVIDFSLIIPHIENPQAVPILNMEFDIKGTNLKNLTIQEVLEWAYQNYVLKRHKTAIVA